MENRKPNTTCQRCGKPIYRRPSLLAKLATVACSHSCSNKLREHPHLYTPEAIAKRSAKMMGENNPSWRGGRYVEPNKGYVMVRMPNHPRARHNGYVLEHILVAEQMLGRSLTSEEEVHHINHDRSDNRQENLKIYASHLEHWMEEHYADVASARDAAALERNGKDLAHL
jgi:ribosomal protein L37E